MATLNICRLPEDIHAKLRVRAAKAGRSMEAEALESFRGSLFARLCRESGANGNLCPMPISLPSPSSPAVS